MREYLCDAKGGQAIARSHHNQTQCGKGNHDQEALSTTPEIKHLRQWDIKGSCHAIGNNVDDGQQRVCLEFARRERYEIVQD